MVKLRLKPLWLFIIEMTFTYFQWTDDRQGFQIQYSTLDTSPGSIKSKLLDYNVLSIRVTYQESSIGFENLAYLQSIENKCNSLIVLSSGPFSISPWLTMLLLFDVLLLYAPIYCFHLLISKTLCPRFQ